MDSLIEKYLKSSLTKKEEFALYHLLKSDKSNLAYFKAKITEYGITDLVHIDLDTEKTFEKLKFQIQQQKEPSKVISLSQYLKYAAVFALVFGLGYYLLVQRDNTVQDNPVAQAADSTETSTDKIRLTLADGSIKEIQESEAELSYLDKSETTSELVYNELIVPRGDIFKVILSDSTVVWLNADSKLKYPKYFVDSVSERKVMLEGEAYFDVAHNADRPFIVQTNEVDIQVLGTAFNISSYQNEKSVNTTLIEGSVKVNERDNPANELLISPNQQASFDKTVGVLSSKKVDVSYYTAWVQRRIVFQDTPFEEILEKIKRVYNVEIENNRTSLNQKRFTGEFDIENIEMIFKALSSTIPFEYKIEEQKVTIKK